MTEVFEFSEGNKPLLVSIPHDGREIPDELRGRMTPRALELPDTDWHVAALYEFASQAGASIIKANYSRYVVDLNRAADDALLYEGQVATGLCPELTFAGEPIYASGATIDADEQRARVARYWQPYHDRIRGTLASLRERYGYALLWDAHSIPSRVPRLFDGELPVLNIGTWDGRSCAPPIVEELLRIAGASRFDAVFNARFKGGHITRHYGDPANRMHAIQLEIAQRAYMDEASRVFDDSRAALLRTTLRPMLESFVDAAGRYHAAKPGA